MKIEDILAFAGPKQVHSEGAEGVEGDYTLSVVPGSCDQCGEEIAVGSEHHRWTLIKSARFCGFIVGAFCSAPCREAWWCSGADVDPFLIDGPADLGSDTKPARDRKRPSFFWADPADPRWQSEWIGLQNDVDLIVTIADQDPGRALQEAVWNGLDGQTRTRIPMQESKRHLFEALPAGADLLVRVIPEHILGQILFSDPIEFHRWWRAPVSQEESAHDVQLWHELARSFTRS